MSSPLNLAVRNQIELQTGYNVKPVAAVPKAIKQAIHYHFNVENIIKQDNTEGKEQEQGTENKDAIDSFLETALSSQNSGSKSEAKQTQKLVSSIIRNAIDGRASDIHIEPQATGTKIRYRIDGILQNSMELPASVQQEITSHIKIMAGMDISERRLPQDGHITIPHGGKQYDLRISSLPSITGEKIVIRVLDKNAQKWSLDLVASEPEDNKKLRNLISNPYGIILVTGPTGSGKTTTLYSLLRELNTPEKNIITVEDPVEYVIEGITQVQVKRTAGMTFASALRSILRQDPDIILIGEIRDKETAEIAISAALTGHLVLSTLHTNDAAGAVTRLINMGMPAYLVSTAVIAAIAQRLIRTLCPQCSEKHTPDYYELQTINKYKQIDHNTQIQRSKGCVNCYQTGYYGRKSIYEILELSPEIMKMVVEGRQGAQIQNRAVEEGMRTLTQNAIKEVLKGNTSFEEMMRVISTGRS
jgi:type IV pilus assembly protein PilB